MMLAPVHKSIKIKDDYRMIVISDIHGHLDRLKQLLQKVEYVPNEDYLIILGDFVEKGDQVLDTIHYVQKLNRNNRCYVLAGNCEWALSSMLSIPELSKHIPHYLHRISSNGVIRDLIREKDLHHDTILGIQKSLHDFLYEEIKYLDHLPVSLKVNDYLFVHAGVDYIQDYKQSKLTTYLEKQDFMTQGHLLKETVIIGHIPTSNYRDTINNDIYFNKEKRIIAIDGGTGVKPISQLNALIITSKDNKTSYKQESIQPLPIVYTNKKRVYKQDYMKVSYPHFEIEILEKSDAFTLCKYVNKDILIKNEFIYTRDNKTYCLDDYTSYFLSFDKDTPLKVVGIYGDYYYCIKDSIVGWVIKDDIV